MRGPAVFGGLVLLLASLAEGLAVSPAQREGHKEIGLYLPKQIQWKDGPASLPPGAKFAMLEGDPDKDGPFVMRLLLPDGYRIPPHMHPKAERLTVLGGTFNIGMGDTFNPREGHEMPTGTFGTWPAGMKHFVWAKGETVIQLHGMGPWEIKYLNPSDDPRHSKK